MDDCIKERNEAFLSLDRFKIEKYCIKYGITMPHDDVAFWGRVHKTICNMYLIPENNVTEEQYERSKKWLKENNFTKSIK